VTFAGSPDRIEARLVPEAGFELDTFRVSGLPRRPGLGQARAAALAAGAPAACLRILGRRRPHVVLGGGGYVAGPMVLAAWLRRIPAALMEADAHLGLANRLAAPFARRVFLAVPVEARSGAKYIVTGRPVPVRSVAGSRDDARRLFELPEAGPVVLVFGGSQGARSLNETIADAFAEDGPAVVHLAGERDYEALRERVRRPDYRLLAYTHEFGAALAASDLVVARAGGSIWEVAAAGKPAVLVPYPHATADHQTKNAEHFAAAGGAVVVADTDVVRVPELVRSLLGNGVRLAAMGEAMLRAARPDAARVIAQEVVALAEAGR
jgi:UDP-N-acetylglucosamine--N-acetylmuramyl-(pentapeptide) pyrophosphoryl-undecaprenol N-acetylglucosamine transferase